MTTESEYEGPMLQVIKRLEGVNVYAYLFSHYSDAEMIGLPWKGQHFLTVHCLKRNGY